MNKNNEIYERLISGKLNKFMTKGTIDEFISLHDLCTNEYRCFCIDYTEHELKEKCINCPMADKFIKANKNMRVKYDC